MVVNNSFRSSHRQYRILNIPNIAGVGWLFENACLDFVFTGLIHPNTFSDLKDGNGIHHVKCGSRPRFYGIRDLFGFGFHVVFS